MTSNRASSTDMENYNAFSEALKSGDMNEITRCAAQTDFGMFGYSVFHDLVFNDQKDILKCLLPFIPLPHQSSYVIRYAIEKNHEELFDCLLETVDGFAHKGFPMGVAIENNHVLFLEKMIEKSNVAVSAMERGLMLERAIQYHKEEIIHVLAQWLAEHEDSLYYLCEAVKKAVANYSVPISFMTHHEIEQEQVQNDKTLTLLFHWVSWEGLSLHLSEKMKTFVYPLYEKWDVLRQQKQLTETIEQYAPKEVAKRKI